jgi:hypothetical protein
VLCQEYVPTPNGGAFTPGNIPRTAAPFRLCSLPKGHVDPSTISVPVQSRRSRRHASRLPISSPVVCVELTQSQLGTCMVQPHYQLQSANPRAEQKAASEHVFIPHDTLRAALKSEQSQAAGAVMYLLAVNETVCCWLVAVSNTLEELSSPHDSSACLMCVS